ncbi:type III secretion system needle length determinant, SpaN/EivJ family [Burkholderia sp. GbtcB21]|uniref:SpaN/EivJ family type III secretion system needle length determinant n=1 Tax=Burkholderia sp. GbtcB21 TaxID=2824766 RepID=UPI001C2F8306|nr:type III secretion system needle length determinant, SpaN/EivJ family [Burkholderia sp. GbtcB21]
METVIPVAFPGDGAMASPDDTDSLMDSLSRELARREPQPRNEEERDRESAAEARPWLPPLPPALAALRRNQAGQVAAAVEPEGRSQSLPMGALPQGGGAAPHSRSAWPLAELVRGKAAVRPGGLEGKDGALPLLRAALSLPETVGRMMAAKSGAQDGKHPAALPEAARVVAASMAAADGGLAFLSGQIAAAPEHAALPHSVERKPRPDALPLHGGPVQSDAAAPEHAGLASSASALPHSVERKPRPDALPLHGGGPVQSAPPSRLTPSPSTQARQESAPGLPRHARSERAPAVDAPQSGLTYRFSRWGGEHAVTVQAPANGVLLLQPSDALVAQRLSEQWQSGNPQQWQLARDGGKGGEEGGEQRQRPQQEEDEA